MICMLQKYTKVRIKLLTQISKLIIKLKIKTLINPKLMNLILGFCLQPINPFHVITMDVSVRYDLALFLLKSYPWSIPSTLVCRDPFAFLSVPCRWDQIIVLWAVTF